MHVLLHVHIAGAGEVGILVADRGGADGKWAVRVLGAVDKSEQVAIVEIPEAVTSSTTVTAPAIDFRMRSASSKQTSKLSARTWNNRSPGVAGAW